MTILNVISKIDQIYPNSFSTEEKLDWINEIEGLVCAELAKSYSYIETTLSPEDTILELPEGIRFEDIECIFLNGRQIPKIDFRSYNIFGFGKSLTVSSDKPITVRAVYVARHKPVLITERTYASLNFAGNQITFAGSDIPFSPGDTIEISGCTAPQNNKQILVLSVDENIITTSDNAFTACSSPASISLVLNQNLRVMPPYDKMYVEYLQAKIDQYNRDFEAYQNSMIVFNTTWVSYSRYLKQRMPEAANASFKNYW